MTSLTFETSLTLCQPALEYIHLTAPQFDIYDARTIVVYRYDESIRGFASISHTPQEKMIKYLNLDDLYDEKDFMLNLIQKIGLPSIEELREDQKNRIYQLRDLDGNLLFANLKPRVQEVKTSTFVTKTTNSKRGRPPQERNEDDSQNKSQRGRQLRAKLVYLPHNT